MSREWLEADGLGGFASGPCEGPRTRRYHALLLVAQGGARTILVNGVDAHVETAGGRWSLNPQRYAAALVPGAIVESFAPEPWPSWVYRLPDGTRVAHEIVALHGRQETHMRWRVLGSPEGPVRLIVRPFVSGRDYHALHHANDVLRWDPLQVEAHRVVLRPYESVPAITWAHNGVYQHRPYWYRSFFYSDEAERGLDAVEDLAAPGDVEFDLRLDSARLVLASGDVAAAATDLAFTQERARRARFGTSLGRAADQYIVARPDGGKSIIAGYPWFTDWGRDTFIALRGLCLATGRLSEAEAIVRRWARVVSQGMLPNRFPDGDGAPEYNAVDASLWYIVAAYELMQASGKGSPEIGAAIDEILTGYADGTRYGIHATADGLLAAGEPGVQLTWMDAKVGDWVVTPRVGKPVEVQALWLNALWIGAELELKSSDRWRALLARGRAAFATRFWDESRAHLKDVIDVDHREGVDDSTMRPNQIYAVGGLPLVLLNADQARAVVNATEARLLTPRGLRSLAPDEPGYHGRYAGGVRERDGAYHQGTVWPFLLGAFVEAWVRVRGGTPAAKAEARARFVAPLLAGLDGGGVGHVPEVASGDAPHEAGGCPFQAWSLGELLRVDRVVLANFEAHGSVPAVA